MVNIGYGQGQGGGDSKATIKIPTPGSGIFSGAINAVPNIVPGATTVKKSTANMGDNYTLIANPLNVFGGQEHVENMVFNNGGVGNGGIINSAAQVITKKENTTGSFSFFNGNQLPGSNPNFSFSLGNLPLGGNNTVYLPFGGNNNQQPGSNPYIIMPGGTGSSTDNSTGLDWTMLLILGAVGLGGAYLIGGRKK